ncbi:MAG TPA: translation initiation factor 2 [Desulfotomaculum sp.]|nr:MAG: translation initiation factor 2 [Peptococcaceae bacterium BRH_c8a]KJS77559.1 MAG: translation initiation factor 2 [Desulfotomaculum sp. BICA1-6]HBX22479.1 translation initiation factor 2 [Desulfotomaculum sp.]
MWHGGDAVEPYADLKFFQYRVRELEEKVEQLRLSRRVLMNLVEKLEKEKTCILARLETENRRLHRDNNKYARRLLKKNSQLVELKSKLEEHTN